MSYTTEPMDSLPSIAEAFGHSGEWQALSEYNPDLPDPHNIQPGMDLLIPPDWIQAEVVSEETTATTTEDESEYSEVSSSRSRRSGTSSTSSNAE